VGREGYMVSSLDWFKLLWAILSKPRLPQVELSELSYDYLGEVTEIKWPGSMQAGSAIWFRL
jgi:hypothetical protein